MLISLELNPAPHNHENKETDGEDTPSDDLTCAVHE